MLSSLNVKGCVANMVSSSELHKAYNDLYEEMRRYIWSFNTVELLADLEVATYCAFPDIRKVLSCLTKLRYAVNPTFQDDEELKKAFDKFDSVISDTDSTYVSLGSVKEVVQG